MPVTTRRQARDARFHLNLNNLPAEIIQEIAHHLSPASEETDSSDFSDVEYDDMSVISMDPADGTPEVKVLPCCGCRPGEKDLSADERAIPVLDERSIFSAASKRIRDVVFNRRQTRRRTSRYCDWWKQETMALPEAARSRYTNLRILANHKHTVDPDAGELLSFLQCFPNLQVASISWAIIHSRPHLTPSLKPTTGPVTGLANLRRLEILLHPDYIGDATHGPEEYGMYELVDLFRHLPLPYVKDLGVFFEAFINSHMHLGASVVSEFDQTCKAMQFVSLESFHLGFNYEVYGLPIEDFWEFLLQMTECVLRSTGVTSIYLKPRFVFDCFGEVMGDVFTKTAEGITLHPAYLPSQDLLVKWVHRLKVRHPHLETFRLDIEYSTLEDAICDLSTDEIMLEFGHYDANADLDRYERPVIRENMDLRHPQAQTKACKFSYRAYPLVINECYDRLVREGEEQRLREAVEEVAVQDAMTAGNAAGVVAVAGGPG